MITPKEQKFKEGDIVICIINSRATLTIGKEYKVKRLYVDDDYTDLILDNDKGEETWYDSMRFIPKDEFRKIGRAHV